MDEVLALSQLDFAAIFIGVIIILVAIKFVVTLFEWFVNKLGLETKWMRQKRESEEMAKRDHELLIKTTENVNKLQEIHNSDTDKITLFMDKMEKQMSQFADNRIHDREQSREIQKELNDHIKTIADASAANKAQIDNLMIADREILANKINDKYKYYLSIKGIPEDEYDEFIKLHDAYKGCGGNSTGDAKFEYCINHLDVIPVETKLVLKHD